MSRQALFTFIGYNKHNYIAHPCFLWIQNLSLNILLRQRMRKGKRHWDWGLILCMFNSCLWIISTINADFIHNQVGLFMFEWKAHIFAHTKLYCELKKFFKNQFLLFRQLCSNQRLKNEGSGNCQHKLGVLMCWIFYVVS